MLKTIKSVSEGPAIGSLTLPSVVVRVVVTGNEHVPVVEKLKARGADEEFVLEGELTLMHDVFCLLLDCSSACKSLMI